MHSSLLNYSLAFLLSLSIHPFAGIASHGIAPIEDVQLVADEAEAVLAILSKKKSSQPITEADWNRLFSSEGYQRLKKREDSVGRGFQDEDFQRFVTSDELLERTEILKETLFQWKEADIDQAAEHALDYLPDGTSLETKLYPVIKPMTNSFVFELDTDPAIFLYLNPDLNRAQFENTLAHELHHVGIASSCLPYYEKKEFLQKSEDIRKVIEWAGAFGEGLAMLAAAGGPDIHPHESSSQEDRERWDRDMKNLFQDFKKVEKFFIDILEGSLSTEDEIRKVGFSFFGVQGPWYTVGWKMAVTIEKEYDRQKLIECLCNPAKLIAIYNEAAARFNSNNREKALPLWSPSLLDALQGEVG